MDILQSLATDAFNITACYYDMLGTAWPCVSFSRTATANDCFSYFSCCCCCYCCYLKSTGFLQTRSYCTSIQMQERGLEILHGEGPLWEFITYEIFKMKFRNYDSHVQAPEFYTGRVMTLVHDGSCQSWGHHPAALQRTSLVQLTWISSLISLSSLDTKIRTAQTLGSVIRQVWLERKVFAK